MTIEKALYSVLSSDSAIAALVSTRIYPSEAPPSGVMPYLIYTKISGVRFQSLEGPTGRAHPRFQIDCYGQSFALAKAVFEAVRLRLDGYAGVQDDITIGASMLDDERNLTEPVRAGTDQTVHRISADFLLIHTEGI